MSITRTFTNHELSNKFLTNEEISKSCPLAFADCPTNPSVSGRYVQANTLTVVEDLRQLGWFPVEAKQCRGKKGSSGIRSFHMIVFQNPKIVKHLENGETEIDAYPRIILTNSHDGFNAFKFMVGLFRLICSNGLVCGEQMVNMSIRHINYDFEELRKVVATAIEQIPDIVATMNEMKKIVPTEEQKKEIATEVIKIRRGVGEDETIEVTQEVIDDILTPIRNADKGEDLWTIFNVCQEKMIKGGFHYAVTRKVRKQRPITSIKKDMEFNQRLWQRASKMMVA